MSSLLSWGERVTPLSLHKRNGIGYTYRLRETAGVDQFTGTGGSLVLSKLGLLHWSYFVADLKDH